MRGFAFNRSDMTREGYQRHHLIPVEVVCQPALASIMNPLITTGFNPREFTTNGVWLPASEQVAIKTGLPLHRGPHPHYNAFVSDQVAFLSRGLAIPSRDGLVALKLRLNNLQGNLWRALSRADTSMWLSRRDPRQDLAEFATFDDDLRQLSMTDLLF